jgi:hypothetical protein
VLVLSFLSEHTVDRYDAKLRPVLAHSSQGDNCSSPVPLTKLFGPIVVDPVEN